MELPWKKKQRIKMELEILEREQLQEKFGNEILAFLTTEASKNKLYGNCPNTKGTIKFECQKTNGGAFSIIAGIPDKSVAISSMLYTKGRGIYQIDTDLNSIGHELQTTKLPYGPSRDWSIVNLESFKKTMSYNLINYGT